MSCDDGLNWGGSGGEAREQMSLGYRAVAKLTGLNEWAEAGVMQ